jgi:hypothetical protein
MSCPFCTVWPFGDFDALQIAAFQGAHLDMAVGVNLADVIVRDGDVAAQRRSGRDARGMATVLTAVLLGARQQRRGERCEQRQYGGESSPVLQSWVLSVHSRSSARGGSGRGGSVIPDRGSDLRRPH